MGTTKRKATIGMATAIHKLSLVMLSTTLMACCSGTTDYFKSADIDHNRWSVSDSVFFPIHIAEVQDVVNRIKFEHDYNLTLTYRHSHDYRYQQIPVAVSIEQADSTGWKSCANPFKVTMPTVDEQGFFDGDGWGSLYKKEFLITGRKIRFPEAGDYRIVILPDTTLEGIVSMTVELD